MDRRQRDSGEYVLTVLRYPRSQLPHFHDPHGMHTQHPDSQDPNPAARWYPQWLFHVPQDFEGMLKLLGRQLLMSRLDTLFTANGTSNLPDTTGLIGSYAQGNEPSHHVIFWYHLRSAQNSLSSCPQP